jgi:hypothetical protein
MRYLIMFGILAVISLTMFASCAEDSGGGGGVYACNYEKRATGCGGIGWGDWEAYSYEFDIDDYVEGWTPERVCDKFSGSDTHCAGGCCIDIQYQNNEVAKGECDCNEVECI